VKFSTLASSDFSHDDESTLEAGTLPRRECHCVIIVRNATKGVATMPRQVILFFSMTHGLRFLVLIIAMESPILAERAEAAPPVAPESPTPDEGIAARYLRDAGIAKDSAVILADDFESWEENGTQPPAGTWTVRTRSGCRVRVVPGQVRAANPPGPGGRVLELAYWKPDQVFTSGGLELLLGNYNSAKDGKGEGYEEVYIRYYIKLDDEYKDVGKTHGSNLGGRDPIRSGGWWVGKSGILDVGHVHYFYSGLQLNPLSNGGKKIDSSKREWEFGFYSYHLDKRTAFGDDIKAQEPAVIRPGEWHCVERRLKLNSVDTDAPAPVVQMPPEPPAEKRKTKDEQAAWLAQLRDARDKLNVNARLDGIEELWVDGGRTISRPIRYRRDPQLRITYFALEHWYPNLPAEYTAEHPVKFYYDHLVIATKFIGPVQGMTPQSTEN